MKHALIFFLTLLYLLIEFALNARVLDLSGPNSSPDSLVGIEFWGRILLGCGLGLFLWKLIPGKKLASLCICLIVMIPTAYFGQKAVVDHLVESTSAEFRRDAAHLSFVSAAIERGEVPIRGLPVLGDEWHEPHGRVFLALFPLVMATDPEFKQQIANTLLPIARKQAMIELSKQPISESNNSEPVIAELREEYERYRLLQDTHIRQHEANVEEAWKVFQARLERLGVNAYRPTKFQQSSIRKELHRNRIQVHDNWKLYDKAGFENAWMDRKQRLGIGVDETDVQQLPKGLNWEEFKAHPLIQSRIKKQLAELKLPVSDEIIDIEKIANNEAKIESAANSIIQPLIADPEQYLAGATYSELGLNAARRAIVPGVAIGFSLFGSLLNLAALVLTILFLTLRYKRHILTVCITVTMISASIFLLDTNQITGSETYNTMILALSENTPAWQIAIFDWIIRLEPAIYRVGDVLRQSVLMGWEFQ